jgi:Ca-activated chloride channel family protein
MMNQRHVPQWCQRLIAPCLAVAVLSTVLAHSARAAGLLIADNGFGGVLEIKVQDVKVAINNGIAVTEVEQVFLNTENRVVEALYTFPVPKGASVSNFSMWIGGKEMTGEVVEKQRARQIYESYKQTRRDPGLLEQVDYKRFEMRVFPIAAGAEQRVKITYAQELDYDHDTATYVYPLASVTTAKVDQRTRGRFALSLEARSEVPIVAMKSPSHGDEFVVAQHAANYWQASLETREGDLSRDLVIVYQMERARTGLDLIASKHAGEDGYFLLTLTAGKELDGPTGGSDYVFVLDASGSMADDGKLSLSRGSIERFVSALDDNDRFELLAFNITSRPLFGSLQAAAAEAKTQAEQFLRAQRAMGGTVLRPAVEAAYRYRREDRPLNVVILSDGMTEPQEQAELVRLMAQRPTNVTVYCVGVGNEVNRPLLTQLAHDAGGLAAFVSAGDDFERQAQAFRRKLMRPAAKRVKLTFQGGDVYDLEPPTLLDEADDRYVCLTAHSLLFSRLHKLRGFAESLEDFYLEPQNVHRVLDMIVDFKIRQVEELHRRFGDRIDALFVADDWGTQEGTFAGLNILRDFFVPRYKIIFDAIHACGWHVILHSCGRINLFVPTLIELGVDVLNMQQSRSYGLVEFGEQFRGQVCFLATVDIQSTLPRGVEEEIREEARLLVRHWGTPTGGLIAFDYGAWEALGVRPEVPQIMFDEFARLQRYWQEGTT